MRPQVVVPTGKRRLKRLVRLVVCPASHCLERFTLAELVDHLRVMHPVVKRRRVTREAR